MVPNEEILDSTRKQARQKLGFYIHFACYLVVNIALLITWIVYYKVTDVMGLFSILSGTFIGWGIGIVAHFVSVFTGQPKSESKKNSTK